LEATCPRCNETLRDADRYCPACGLPHLTYVAAEGSVLQLGTLADGRADAQEPVISVSGIAWRPALNASMMLAVPAGVLCSTLSTVGQSLWMVWMVGAAAWAVALYGKRTRRTKIAASAGARIGFVTGLFASWLTLSLNGVTLWVQRFIFHQGGQMDSDWSALLGKFLEAYQQSFAQSSVPPAQANQFLQATKAMMLSAEGRAGFQLTVLLFGSSVLTLFAVIGGAVSTRFFATSRRP
jgi:hypothetical protein